MQSSFRYLKIHQAKILAAGFLLFVACSSFVSQAAADNTDDAKNGRLITIHDRGQEKVVLTHARTVQDALSDAAIKTDQDDIVEPKRDSELIATDYTVNIYRARPVIVQDGMVKQKIMTAAQTPKDIASSADIVLRPEDKVSLSSSGDIATDGASIVLAIDRAVKFTLQMYGTPTEAYSHAETVGEMLTQKGVTLSAQDTVTPGTATKLTGSMTVTVWREGVQTATVEEQTAFPVRKVQDADQPIGYNKIQTPGKPGLKKVTYEITASNGRETGRKAIQAIMTVEPVEQVEVIGIKPGPNSLTKAKGAQQFVDSKGISHRETYYDLPMNVVMGACGGEKYTIRADGAKVDKDGYVLIAAHLGNYPRCSIVETSMGLGKVYDTGGFAAKHPHGFDLATDWTNGDGR